MTPPSFRCGKCGIECAIEPLEGPAVCEQCCEDHDFEYEPSERAHLCKHCNAQRPDDWYDE